MHKRSTLNAALAVAALVAWPLVQAAPISRAEYDAGRKHIRDAYKAERAACNSFSDNAKDVCVEAANAKARVSRAELAYAASGRPADRHRAVVVKA